MHSRPMAVIFLTVFVDMLGFGILIPVIPNLFVDPQNPTYMLGPGSASDHGYLLLGLLLSVFPFFQFISAPILGQLSDRFGRKRILSLCLAGTSVANLLFSLGIFRKIVWLLFFARAIDGLTGGNISVARAASADISSPKDRAKNFGLIGAAFGLGFIFGPYLGGKLSDPSLVSWFSSSTPFVFAAILSAINSLFVLLLFPETLKDKNLQNHIQWHSSIKNIFKALTMKGLRVMFVTTFFGVFLIKKFMFTQSNVGDFLSYVGLWMVFTQMFLTRKASNRFKEYQILKISLVGTGVGILLYLFALASWQLIFIAPIFAICNGLSQANLGALISRSSSQTAQGEIMGIVASIQAVAQIISPIIAGVIASDLNPSSPILTSSLILTLSGIFFIKYFNPQKHYLFVDTK